MDRVYHGDNSYPDGRSAQETRMGVPTPEPWCYLDTQMTTATDTPSTSNKQPWPQQSSTVLVIFLHGATGSSC